MPWNNKKRTYTPQRAKELAARLCAKRERSQAEIRQKLREYGLNDLQAEEILTELLELGFVSDRRFVHAYVRGKFYQLGWGRLKIREGLRHHNIPDKLIAAAIEEEIPESSYRKVAVNLLERKQELIDSEKLHFLKKKKKLMDYMTQKGYESSLISEILDRK